MMSEDHYLARLAMAAIPTARTSSYINVVNRKRNDTLLLYILDSSSNPAVAV